MVDEQLKVNNEALDTLIEQNLALKEENVDLKQQLGRLRQQRAYDIIDNPSLGLQPI